MNLLLYHMAKPPIPWRGGFLETDRIFYSLRETQVVSVTAAS